jgi:hypothetical protein
MPPTRNPKTRPALQTTRQETVNRSHPSNGGACRYDLATRQMALTVKFDGAEEDDVFTGLRQQRLHPSKRTTSWWAHRLATEGHFHPYKMNGNNPATSLKGNGNKLIMLTIYRFCYPKATAAEINAFLFSCTLPGDPWQFFLRIPN